MKTPTTPKTPKIYWRETCKAYYAHWKRPNEVYKQHWLGKEPGEAKDNLARLMRGEDVKRVQRSEARPVLGDPTIKQVVDKFLAAVEANPEQKPATHKWYKQFLDSYSADSGTLRVSKLKKHHVLDWINSQTQWKDNSRHAAARAVLACFNWAVDVGYLATSPVKGFKKTKAVPRTDAGLKADEWKALIKGIEADTAFRDLVMFMRVTGARPEEARTAEKRHFSPAAQTITFSQHEWKNGKKTKQERVIHLTGEALTIVQKLADVYPAGPLFRNAKGTAWNKDSLSRKFSRVGERLTLPNLIPYSIRHTYAEDMAFKVDSIILAKLMGTSVKMLASVYAKVEQQKERMREAAAKVNEGLA